MFLKKNSSFLPARHSAKKSWRRDDLMDRTPKNANLSNQMLLLIITISLFLFLYISSVILFREDNFGSPVLFFNTFFNSKPFLLAISLGMTIVMISGSIDISVGSVVGLV